MDVTLPAGFYPFWFWNDRLSADEIRWQVGEMAEKGVRGFFIHPRQGLGQPYLSEAFLEMVDVAVVAAKEHGLVVHLYDEYPYPSGIAGGEVTLGCPQYHATKLVQESYVVEGGQVRLDLPRGKVLSCVAYPRQNGQTDWGQPLDLRNQVGVVLKASSYLETGLTRYNRKRFFASEPTPVLEVTLPERTCEVVVSVQVVVEGFKYWDHYVDVLNPEAIQRFIELTHERYRQRYAQEFGRSVVSIFVDETRPQWSDGVPDAFLAEYGYALPEALPALHDAGHPDHIRVSYDLHRLLYKMFCASFEGPISEWCRANGLAYSGEKPSLRMAQLRYMDLPGCEPGHTKVGARLDLLQAPLRSNAKATASAAYLYGKQGALCECYHSTGWSATLQDAKFIADGLLLMGIKYLVPHGFFYSTHGLRKHDAPPTFFFQMPFWPMFAKLSERVERIGSLLEGTYVDAEVLLVEPASGVPARGDGEVYARIHWMLMESHLDYHVVDTDILEDSQIEEGRVCLRDLRAKAVIVPPMRVIEEPLQAWLARYEAAGGRVFYCHAEGDLEALRSVLRNVVQPSLSVRVGGLEAAAVMVVKRVGGGKTLWFVLHTGDQTIEAELWSGGNLQEVPLDEGLPALLERDGERYRRKIRPYESFVVEAVESPPVPPRLSRIKVSVGGKMEVQPLGPNLLRMYDWRMTLLAEGEPCGESAVVGAVPLANQLEQGGFRFAPAMVKRFGHPPELAFPELQVRYEYTFGCNYTDRVELVMEPGSIGGEWAIYVSQGPPIRQEDLRPTAAHVRGSLGIEVTGMLRPGRNAILVEVRTTGGDGGLLNPLYLAGDFGVTLDPLGLVPRPRVGAFEGYEENLLPYYAGAIEYTSSFTLQHAPRGERVLVEFDYGLPFHEATEVSINGGEYQRVLWEPRVIALPADSLRAGTNTLRTRVYTTQIRAFEGQWFDYTAHQYRDVGEGQDAR